MSGNSAVVGAPLSSCSSFVVRYVSIVFFFFSSRRRHTRFDCDWSSDVCSSDLPTSIEYRDRPDSGEPYVIVADRVRFKGNDRMWGAGQVTIDRSDFAARGDSIDRKSVV